MLALNIGASNWKEWESHIQAEAIGDLANLNDLATFDTDNDPNNVLGNRWLCKGGSCLFVGQSGIGKSSLSLQLAMNWALGRTVFGSSTFFFGLGQGFIEDFDRQNRRVRIFPKELRIHRLVLPQTR